METYNIEGDQNLKVTVGAHDLQGVIGISLDGVLLFPSLDLTTVPEKYNDCPKCKDGEKGELLHEQTDIYVDPWFPPNEEGELNFLKPKDPYVVYREANFSE